MRRHTPLTAPALVAVSMALLLAACGNGGDGEDEASATTTTDATTTSVQTTAPSTTTTALEPSTTAAPSTIESTTTTPSTTVAPTTAPPAGRSVVPTRLAAGTLTAIAPDGSHAVLSEIVDGLSEPGCEGELEPVLTRVPIEGGETTPMFGAGQLFNGELDDLGDGRAVLLSGCEEFLEQMVVFAWSPDGVLSQPFVVPRFSGATIENFLGVAWSEGDVVFGLGTTFSFEGLDTRVVSIDPATGAVTDVLPAEGAIVVGRLAGDVVSIGDGEMVTVVPLDGGPPIDQIRGQWLTVSPDGSAFAVVGPGLTIHRLDADPELLTVDAPEGAEVIDASWSPDGRRIAYVARGVEDSIGVIELGGVATRLDTARRVFGPQWSADGTLLGYTRIQEETEGELGEFEAMVARLGG